MEESILYSEINGACAMILLLLSFKVGRSMFLQEQRQLFLRVMLCNVLFLCVDAVWIFADNNVLGMSVGVNWALNMLYYILSGILGCCWFGYSETVQGSRFVSDKRYQRLSLAPMLLLTVLTLVSYKTGWLFYIDSQNQYHRGPAYALQLLTAYGYVIFTAAKAFYLSCRTEDYRRKSEMQALASFVLPTLLAGTMQVLFPGYPILCVGNTVGILYVYITLQEQLISQDALTRLNNRNQLLQYLSVKMAHPHEDRVLYLLMMDIDYFKSINDQYGHVEGDRALKIVAGCLMRASGRHGYFVARYGGDEFVAICELAPTAKVEDCCEEIRAELRKSDVPYPISISIGAAKYTPEVRNQADFIALADQELYRIKKCRPARNSSK